LQWHGTTATANTTIRIHESLLNTVAHAQTHTNLMLANSLLSSPTSPRSITNMSLRCPITSDTTLFPLMLEVVSLVLAVTNAVDTALASLVSLSALPPMHNMLLTPAVCRHSGPLLFHVQYLEASVQGVHLKASKNTADQSLPPSLHIRTLKAWLQEQGSAPCCWNLQRQPHTDLGTSMQVTSKHTSSLASTTAS